MFPFLNFVSCSAVNAKQEFKDVEGLQRKVLVTGLPEGVTENSVYIHFQKKKNGGGEIEAVTFVGGGKAMILFEDPEGLLHCPSYK